MIKLNKTELKILNTLSEETGTIENIEKNSKIEKNKAKKILKKLEKLKLVYSVKTGKNENIDFWCRNKDGDKYLKENMVVNEFGEEFLRKEIKKITEKILKLSNGLIDELWYRCGFVYIPHEFKALNKEHIEDLRKHKENSETLINFIQETHKKDILENLKKIRKKHNNSKTS